MATHSSTLAWKIHGWRSLVCCSPWGRKESDKTERLHFHFPLSCTGEGNGNPLQCFCLENLRDRGAWLAAVYGVAQSWTRLKRLSSSSSTSTLSLSTYKLSFLIAIILQQFLIEYDQYKYRITMVYTWKRYNILNQLYFNFKNQTNCLSLGLEFFELWRWFKWQFYSAILLGKGTL